MPRKQPQRLRGRAGLTRVVLTLAMTVLAGRALQLQVLDSEYLQQQGNSRYLRVVNEVPTRGMILDRNGQPLAISTPVDSLWADPRILSQDPAGRRRLARALSMSETQLRRQLSQNRNKEFMYLKRQVSPDFASNILALEVEGVSVQREYRRYYPAGEAAGHVVGFSNIDDQGQEGLELKYESALSGHAGKSRVLKDRLGHIVEKVDSLGLASDGRDVRLSLDRRIQFLAYRELSRAVEYHGARSGTAVMVDVRTGEILAMVNQPSFNPNNRAGLSGSRVRNRAATDLFEPGSTLKPFVIAAALDAGVIRPGTTIDTSPGRLSIGHQTIHDARDYGRLTVSGIIQKSSNVGAVRVAQRLDKEILARTLHAFGFAAPSGTGLPGEGEGLLTDPERWTRVDHASLAFGYGMSATTLQLVRAYAALANDGLLASLTLQPGGDNRSQQRVVSSETARAVRRMLETAVTPEGTSYAAHIPHYRIAGKTGTAHKYMNGSYSDNNYVALFAGFAPASNPRLAMVITVDDPRRNGYYGGRVAAPVFRKVMAGALRLMNIPPDAPSGKVQHLVQTPDTRRAG